jgi:SNF2 family DNA or RNA helicase
MKPEEVRFVARCLPGGQAFVPWINGWLRQIREYEWRHKFPKLDLARRKAPVKPASRQSAPPAPAPAAETLPPLPRYDFPVSLALALPAAAPPGLAAPDADADAFRLLHELTQLSLLQGFDELLCLPALHGVEPFWYQIEAVRKVLKQFRGRVLLADEVGLGKTIEAGMALKEYLLRGLVERVLILTPAPLVGQWQEELATKFDLECATTYDGLLRQDTHAFWAQPRVIASIATARRPEHHALLAAQRYDLIIVDEAHHLKNRATANWKLVNALNKKFLLLLSATPVQNSLVELYNLLTLLKPGIFKTEKDFRASYMKRHQPRVPANRERMRELMRDVMIRNTRSLVDVHLPPRHAVTQKVTPQPAEAACYRDLTRLVQAFHADAPPAQRLALRHLLAAAGSTSRAAAAALERFLKSRRGSAEWHKLVSRYLTPELTAKERALMELLARNPHEKKLVFVQRRDTLHHLAQLAREARLPFALFEGALSGPDKDRAVRRFQDDVPLLLSTEAGGEGRNLQFCNTLINFDVPWNPMALEQRIGRLHRIGQEREVFIFNLVTKGTVEEQILRLLDEKINMFELVAGEIGAILGELGEEEDFAETVFRAWVETTEATRAQAFDDIGAKLLSAKHEYNATKALDDELFGEDFVAA